MVDAKAAFMAVMDELDRRGYTSAVVSALKDPNVNSMYEDWRRTRGSAVSAYKPEDMISAFAEFMSPRIARKSKRKSRLDYLGVPVRID